MKTRKAITKLTISMAVAALAAAGLLCKAGWLQPVAAQGGDESVKFVSYASIALLPGDKVRLSTSNPNLAANTGWFRYSISNPSGVPLYESEEIQVPSGESRSSDVSRRDLNIEGESGTGRAEVMVTATIQAPAGSKPEDFPVTAEVIKEATGATSGGFILHEYGHGMDTNAPSSVLFGFIPGERLSLTVFNPPEVGGPVRVSAFSYDGLGRLTTTYISDRLQPGQSYTFAINRDDLPVAGEEGTRRFQGRVGVQVAMGDASVRSVKLPFWVSLVNNRTGSTTWSGGPYSTGYVKVSGDGE